MSKRAAAAIEGIASSPAEFRKALQIDAGSVIKPFADCIDPWQRQDFEALDSAWQMVAGRGSGDGKKRAWLERPRGHSKTTDIAVSASYALFASRRQIQGIVAAADEDQAALIRKAINGLCQLNRWLGNCLEVQKNRIVNRLTDSELTILSSDVASSYGHTVQFVICDELTHWTKSELWNSLFSTAPKRPSCVFVVICNAGFSQSWQWPLRESVRVDKRWYFHALPGPVASWIRPEDLEEQRRLLVSDVAFRRLWLNQWSSGSGDAIAEDDLTAALTLAGPSLSVEPGWVYAAGVDIGIRHDATAIAVVGRDVGFHEPVYREKVAPANPTLAAMADLGLLDFSNLTENSEISHYRFKGGSGRLKLMRLDVRRPEDAGGTVSLTEVDRLLLDLHSTYRLSSVGFDPSQARGSAERLAQAGVPVEIVDFTGSNLKSMAEITIRAFVERTIDLYPDETLLADLRNLRAVEKQYGVRLESPRTKTGTGTRHGDAATALAIALHTVRNCVARQPTTVNRPLICWPAAQ